MSSCSKLLRRWMHIYRGASSGDATMSEWINRAARVTTAPESAEILDELTARFGRSPRAIQATIDLLHRIPPRYSEPYVTIEHLRAAFENWQDAFLRGKHATLPEAVVRLKMRRWTKVAPDFVVQTPVDRKMKNTMSWRHGIVGAKGLTEDSSPYEYYKVIRGWANSTLPESTVEIGQLIGRMKDQGIALSILLGLFEDRGAMQSLEVPEAIQVLLENGIDKLIVRTAIKAGRSVVNRFHEPNSFRVGRDVLDTFKRYKASTPEAVHLSFDLMENMVKESQNKDWFGATPYYHTNLFNNYKRAARYHHVFGAQLMAIRIKEWSQTGMFQYSKSTIKLLLDVVAAQRARQDAVLFMEEIIKVLSDKSVRAIALHAPVYRTLVKAWADSRRPEASAKIMEIVDGASTDDLDVGVYNVVLHFWSDDLERMEWTILKMHQRGVRMNSFSWLQVLECYVSRNLMEKAEWALFRMNDSMESDHDEEILARGLFVLIKAYLSNARKSGDIEIVEKCQLLYKEIVVNGKLQAKTREKILVVMKEIEQLDTRIALPTQIEATMEDDIFPVYADEEDDCFEENSPEDELYRKENSQKDDHDEDDDDSPEDLF